MQGRYNRVGKAGNCLGKLMCTVTDTIQFDKPIQNQINLVIDRLANPQHFLFMLTTLACQHVGISPDPLTQPSTGWHLTLFPPKETEKCLTQPHTVSFPHSYSFTAQVYLCHFMQRLWIVHTSIHVAASKKMRTSKQRSAKMNRYF